MSGDIKQVIVMRKDLNMRKGKMIAQGAHASMAFLSNLLQGHRVNNELTKAEWDWIRGSFKKICVSVNSEDELFEIQQKAKLVGIHCEIILDNGLTEFGGVPTYTCLALGPDYSEKIDKITGDLKLL